MQPQQATGDDCIAVDKILHCRFPSSEHMQTMMSHSQAEPQARPAHVHRAQPSATYALTVHHAEPPAVFIPSVHAAKPPTTSASSTHHRHQVLHERMAIDDEAAAITSSGARWPGPSSGADRRFALVEGVPNIKSMSDSRSPYVEELRSER